MLRQPSVIGFSIKEERMPNAQYATSWASTGKLFDFKWTLSKKKTIKYHLFHPGTWISVNKYLPHMKYTARVPDLDKKRCMTVP